jgi:hypothetical protein
LVPLSNEDCPLEFVALMSQKALCVGYRMTDEDGCDEKGDPHSSEMKPHLHGVIGWRQWKFHGTKVENAIAQRS